MDGKIWTLMNQLIEQTEKERHHLYSSVSFFERGEIGNTLSYPRMVFLQEDFSFGGCAPDIALLRERFFCYKELFPL